MNSTPLPLTPSSPWQDYHLMLLPAVLKEQKPRMKVSKMLVAPPHLRKLDVGYQLHDALPALNAAVERLQFMRRMIKMLAALVS